MPGRQRYQATRMLIKRIRDQPDSHHHGDHQGPRKRTGFWGLRQGAVDYLVKPVSAQALVEKAQAALAT